MDNVCPDENENQYFTSPSGEALGMNFNVRRSEHIRNSPQRYNPVFGAAREWKNDAVASIVYMIQDRYFDSNVYTIRLLISSSIALKYSSQFSPDNSSIYVEVSGSWL